MFTSYTLTLAQTLSDAPSETTPPTLPDADAITSSAQTSSNGITTTTPSDPNGLAPNPNAGPLGSSGVFIMMLLAIVAFMFFSFRSQRKQKKERENMLASLDKGARVSTIGGIIGTVTDVRDNEVVLKVDENANTKIHFSRSSIQTVITKK